MPKWQATMPNVASWNGNARGSACCQVTRAIPGLADAIFNPVRVGIGGYHGQAGGQRRGHRLGENTGVGGDFEQRSDAEAR